MTPIPFRLVAAAIAIVVLCALSAMGGAVVATWKASAGHAVEVRDLLGQIDQLKADKTELQLAIAEQNKGVAVAEAQTLAAEQAKGQAEQHAEDLAAFSKSRMDKLERFMGETAEQVLKAYWELRK